MKIRKFLIIISLMVPGFFKTSYLWAQEKPALDTAAFNAWPRVGSIVISNNGKYISYDIANSLPVQFQKCTLFIQSLRDDWKLSIQGSGQRIKMTFTNDSRYALFITGNDSLNLQSLGVNTKRIIAHVLGYQLIEQGREEWLAYMLNEPAGKLDLENLKTGKKISISSVTNYQISNSGNVLLLTALGKNVNLLSLLDLRSGIQREIWRGNGEVANITLNDKEDALAFCLKGKDQPGNSFWYYHITTGATELILNTGLEAGYGFDGIIRFSHDGSKLFFTEKRLNLSLKTPGMVALDVWTYRDSILQSAQLKNPGTENSIEAVLDINSRSIITLQHPGENVQELNAPLNDRFISIRPYRGDLEPWSRNSNGISYLEAIEDGNKVRLDLQFPTASPDGKFIVGSNQLFTRFFSKNLSTGRIIDLGAMIYSGNYVPDSLVPSNHQNKILYTIKWVRDSGSTILATDGYDLWTLDVSGMIPPICITNGYGKRNRIHFEIEDQDEIEGFKSGSQLLLWATNLKTKDQGYFRVSADWHSDPVKLSMGPYVFADRGAVTKAKEANLYLVRREQINSYPNYYWTKDFKTYKAITHIEPEKQYNWMTTELVKFITPEGTTTQGVIYKPENFDPSKKYPVIIHWYEADQSNELNEFRNPYDRQNFSIPWFIGHGYVVCTTDVFYRDGEAGKCALNAVIGADDYLRTLPWIDPNHIGLQGHSFAGFETNYIITHSNRFAAAISSEGSSDLIAGFNEIVANGSSKQGFIQFSQYRMGVTLWENPTFYLENSAILSAHKVVTPLLLMANEDDGSVPYIQGQELFLALRRLGKPVWMLQYDREGHNLNAGTKPYIDFMLRSQQFFDYYLKDLPAPKWMVEGIPARLKGIDDGFALEPAGVEPGPNLLLPEEQKKVDSLQHRKPVTVSIP